MFSPKKMASLASMVFLLLLLIDPSDACKPPKVPKVVVDAAKVAAKLAEAAAKEAAKLVLGPAAALLPFRKKREAGDSPEAEPSPEAEEDSPIVADLTDPAMNVEPLDPDNMKILEQVVPGKFAIALVNIVPCGVVIAHAHCYADALVYIIKSSPGLEGGYIIENDNVTTVVPIKNLKAGMTVTISRGRVHWVTNQDCNEEVQLLQFFNTDNIDRTRPDVAMASVPAHVLEDSFGIDVARQLSNGPQPDPEDLMVRSASCMARCAKDGRRKMWDHNHN